MAQSISLLNSASTLVYLIPALFVFVVGRFISSHFLNPLNKVPGPWHAKWTNLRLKYAVITGHRIFYVHSLREKYGAHVRIALNEISVADPESFTQIHKVGSGFHKSTWYQSFVDVDRLTLFTMIDPRQHGQRRKLLARAFSKTYLRQNWEPVVRARVNLAVKRMKEESQRDGQVDILKWWTFMATDAITHLCFGDSFHTLEKGEKDKFTRTLGIALIGGGIGAELPLVRAVGKLIPIKTCQMLFQDNIILTETAQIAVDNARTGGEKNLFAHIIEEADKGESLDEEDLKSEATGAIVAGSDTTANSLTYLVWAVVSHPHIRHALEVEVDSLKEEYGDAEVEDLPILNAVIAETLRLYGAAPGGLPRMVPASGAQMGTYFLPGGTTVTTQSYTMHRDQNFFPDPEKFDHTRWLAGDTSRISELAKAVYTPFGAGAHACMGINLARMELRLGTVEFFRQIKGALLSPSTTPESMTFENFFVITPKSHKCEIIC